MGFLQVFWMTLVCYLVAIQVRSWLSVWVEVPVILIASGLLAVMIQAIAISGYFGQFSYLQFWEKSSWLHAVLPVLVVALAIPLYRQWQSISHYLKFILVFIVLLFGTLAWLVAIVFASGMDLSIELREAMVIKSVTTPVALLVGEQLRLDPFVVVGIVMATGMLGAVLGPPLLRLMGVDDERAVGLALGVSSHAIGTARAFGVSSKCGAYASMGLALNGVASAILIPWFYHWVR